MLSSSEEIITTSEESSALDYDDRLEMLSTEQSPSLAETDRINALKSLQASYNQIESLYLKSVYELECRFHEQCSNLFDRRSDVINGKYEPNDEECRLKTDFIDTIERQTIPKESLGIPSFWLQTLKQVPMIAEMIEECDEPILKYLDDIKLRLQTQPTPGFTLEFCFNEQSKEYFRNEILTKFYELQIASEDDLLFYEGTAIVRSIGCHIDWIDSTRNVTQQSQTGELQSSFFNFFISLTNTDDWKLATDFQIGHYIRENLIPKAVLYYTGEIFGDDDDDDEYDLSSDDESIEQQNSFGEEIGEGEHV